MISWAWRWRNLTCSAITVSLLDTLARMKSSAVSICWASAMRSTRGILLGGMSPTRWTTRSGLSAATHSIGVRAKSQTQRDQTVLQINATKGKYQRKESHGPRIRSSIILDDHGFPSSFLVFSGS
uniref:Putative secreted protein n=1 Tax=Ixodes ricinus TaxID=34613 RepID=A0A6B0UPN3_IXORI